MSAYSLSAHAAECRSPRVARRRERMKAALVAAGVHQFADRGIERVSVADLIAEADVSRATFYGFFSSKYNLLENILDPIFEVAIGAIRALADRPAPEALAGLIDVYVRLWREHREGLLLIPAVNLETFSHFRAQHESLNDAMLAVLTRAENAGLLRNGSARYSLKVIAKTAIPLLRVYDGHPGADSLFRDAMSSLLIGAEK